MTRTGCDADRAAHHAVRHRLASPWRHRRHRFEELRELCTAAGDKVSLAIGMAGLVMEHMHHGRVARGVAAGIRTRWRCSSRSATRPLTLGLLFAAIAAKIQTGEMAAVLRWSQSMIDLADGDPAKATSSSDHRWRWRWCCAVLPDGRLGPRGGERTSTTPSRWPEAADPITCAGVVAVCIQASHREWRAAGRRTRCCENR